MKLTIGKLLKAGLKIAGPLVIGLATAKAQREIEKQAEKLTKKVDRV